jgi:hypothetical protein
MAVALDGVIAVLRRSELVSCGREGERAGEKERMEGGGRRAGKKK